MTGSSRNWPYTWPRHHAAKVLEQPTKEARRAALDAVPEPWRPWVETYVRNHFALRAARREAEQQDQQETAWPPSTPGY